MTVKLGRYEVPGDWPVKGEASHTFKEKLGNGFFSAYMAGEIIIDVGYRGSYDDAVPIFPHGRCLSPFTPWGQESEAPLATPRDRRGSARGRTW